MRDRLQQWFTTTLGQCFLQLEQDIVNDTLSNLFGYHILQIGSVKEEAYYTTSRISHKILIQLQGEAVPGASLNCSAEFLPIESDSMDVVLLPHVLEFTRDPHKLLREVERILIGEGHVIIIGFNPWSLCGLWRLFLAWRDEPPWNGHFYGFPRIKDWLSLLDLELVRVERCFYRPPVQREGMLNKLIFLEKLGKYCWSYFGSIQIITARKRVIPLTPFKVNWHQRRSMIASGLAEPTTRTRINDEYNH